MLGEVKWYEEDVLAQIEGASDEFLDRLAFQVEGEAKVAAKVDTGFMRNAIYTITTAAQAMFGGKPGKGKPSGTYKSKKTGEMVSRKRVNPIPKMPPHTAAVHGAAEYTIDQEMKHHFMYGALVKVIRSEAAAVLRLVRRKRNL